MLLDSDGRRLRRAIGFERAWLVFLETKQDPADAVASEIISVVDELIERNAEPPKTE